jgi:hypothetical protein
MPNTNAITMATTISFCLSCLKKFYRFPGGTGSFPRSSTLSDQRIRATFCLLLALFSVKLTTETKKSRQGKTSARELNAYFFTR